MILHSVCLICGRIYGTREIDSSAYPEQPLGEAVLSHGVCSVPCKAEYRRKYCQEAQCSL